MGMRDAFRFFWRYVLPIVVILWVGWFFYEKLSKADNWQAYVSFHPEWFVLSGLLYLGAHAIWASFSITLLRNQGAVVSATTGLRAYFVSQFGKYVPGKVWVLAIRVGMLGKIGISRTAVGITAFYESITAMSAGALVTAVILWQVFEEVPIVKGISAWWVTPFALAPIGLVGLNRFINRVSRWINGANAKQYPRVKLHLAVRGLLQGSLGWLLLGLGLWACMKGLGIDFPLDSQIWLRLVALNAIAYVIGFLAVFTTAGGGIREGALQIVLAMELIRVLQFDRGSADAIAVIVAVALRLSWTTMEILAAATIWFYHRWTHPKEPILLLESSTPIPSPNMEGVKP